MYIGLGIVLFVLGAILAFALNIDIPGVSDDTLGYHPHGRRRRGDPAVLPRDPPHRGRLLGHP